MDTFNDTNTGASVSALNRAKGYVKQNILLILIGVVVLSSGTSVYFYSQYSELMRDPNKVAQDEVTKLVAQISKIMVLPDGEIPTLATVSDPNKLKDQVFFAKAEAGDKVLIYANAKRAILYNPKSNRIVEVAPIDVGATATPISKPIFKLPAR